MCRWKILRSVDWCFSVTSQKKYFPTFDKDAHQIKHFTEHFYLKRLYMKAVEHKTNESVFVAREPFIRFHVFPLTFDGSLGYMCDVLSST